MTAFEHKGPRYRSPFYLVGRLANSQSHRQCLQSFREQPLTMGWAMFYFTVRAYSFFVHVAPYQRCLQSSNK